VYFQLRLLARMAAKSIVAIIRNGSSAPSNAIRFHLGRNNTHHAGLLIAVALISFSTTNSVRAQDNVSFYEIETKYIFGFTEGSGIGLEGEKEVSMETVTRFDKRDGRNRASETKLEFETTPNQYIQLEMGALVASHNISGVAGLDDRNQVAFSGLFGELPARIEPANFKLQFKFVLNPDVHVLRIGVVRCES
jgi:hypothetical protein